MSVDNKYEKQPPTAPPPYSVLYPTGNSQPEGPQYGFHPPPAQPGYPVQQPGYPSQQPYNSEYPAQQPGYPSQQPYNSGYPSQTTVITQPAVVTQPTVVVMGGCPSCRVGILEDDFTCCGILCAICFFPIGILCCLAMKEKRCTNCKATF